MQRGCRRLVDHRSTESDDGFSLVEVLVAMTILVLVMLASAGFFVNSLKKTNGQSERQAAVTLATEMLEYTRSVPSASLLTGRDQATVQSALIASPGTVDLSQDVKTANNYDPAATSTSSKVVPISYTTNVANGTQAPNVPNLGNVAYTTRTYIDRCYLSTASAACGATDANAGWLFRISVAVQWDQKSGQKCSTSTGLCEYVASSLRDAGSDPCFNSNTSITGCSNVSTSTSTPLISSISPSPVLVGSVTTLTIVGSGFVAGATVIPDAYGTVSNVTFVSANQMTVRFTAGTSAAAVGDRVLKLVNPDTGTAFGSVTVAASSVSVSSVSPNSVANGSTTSLTITGTGFLSGAVVSVDAPAGTVGATTFVSSTSLTVTLTSSAGAGATGSHTATVTNPDGPTGSGSFTVAAPTAPAPVTLTGISPASLLTGSGRTMTLTGTGFATGITVTVDSGGGTVGTVTRTSATQLTFPFTAGTAGTHTFTVRNPDTGTASRPFTVNPAPTVGAFTLSPSKQGSNSTITVSGTGFQTGATYSVNVSGYVINPVITVLSPTQFTFTYNPLPGAGTYGYSSTLTNPDGGTGSSSGNLVVTP